MNGTVKWWNTKKGYGYITTEKGEEFFITHTRIIEDENGFKNLYEGEKVKFEILEEGKSKKAINVKVIEK